MSTDTTAVEDGVRRIVAGVLRTAPGQDDPGPDTDLWSAGLDSMGSVSLMVGLEDEFGIEFPDAMLDRETFSSVRRISEAVRSLV
ncbi:MULTISPECIES: phosphopantetheine-binding protein [Kitasatospora]|uniref:Carrier domain-containing protein n=1 Tax=Kitasatospora arboriphila TaxID=258052 RepID=A0ABN1TGH6_9ACTN